jgi:hypothetical protein
MVNHVVPSAELSSFVIALAGKIAAKPSFALKLTKEAVNRSVDIMGQPAAVDQAFALHQLCHAHNLQEFGMVPAFTLRSDGRRRRRNGHGHHLERRTAAVARERRPLRDRDLYA